MARIFRAMGWGNEPKNPYDLKPFSVDDPLGERQQARAHQQHPPAEPPQQKQRQQRRQQQQAPKEKKSSGCLPAFFGCLGVLFVMGVIAAIPLVFLGGYAKEIYDQWDVRRSGVDGVANVTGVRPTSMEFNEEKVYEVDLRVSPVSGAPFEATLHSPIPDSELALYEGGGRVIVRYDPDDTSRISILGPEDNAPPGTLPPPVVDPAASAEPAADPPLSPSGSPSASTAPDDNRIVVPGGSGTVPLVCRETYLCCRTVQGEAGEEACKNFLVPMPTTRHCEMAIQVFRDVGRQTGKPCRVPN